MAIPSLTPPQDITWKRMAFSRDMLDTNFGDLAFPPKWRTSLTVYYYIVPEEETVDAYPESRIVYLKLSCSITGWNPSEELSETKQQASESDQWDDLQKSIWEVIEASSWASKYWGCHGAIMQIGVFPGKTDDVGPDEYPYIIDFEPKKENCTKLFPKVARYSRARVKASVFRKEALRQKVLRRKPAGALAEWVPRCLERSASKQ